MPAVYLKTFGCQMNERDSEQVLLQLQDRGYTVASSEEDADVILLNTCSVRDQAEQKAIGKMTQLQRHKKDKPEIVLGFLGCMAQSRGDELFQRVPKLDLVVGTQRFHRVADYVDSLVNYKPSAMDDLRSPIVDIEEEEGSQNTIRDHVLKEKQVTAFVSIMQGCNMRCTFCIVPSTRGSERGRPIPQILEEVRQLVDNGVREVTLLGQIVNLYGRHEFPKDDLKRSPFVQLLYALNEIDGLERIRFTSPHPIGFRQDLVEAFGNCSKLCEHVHLPLQSGSNRILKDMHRGYTREKFLRLVESLKEQSPNIAITTDIIVGYPGETDEDYQLTRDLVKEVAFDNAFIFRYSERKDTPAAVMHDCKVSQEDKEFRNKDLLDVISDIAHEKAKKMIGSTVEILVEGPSKNNPKRLAGRTRTNKIVVFEGEDRHHGQLLPVNIVESTGFTFYADAAIHA